jgi:four helix bundle protein
VEEGGCNQRLPAIVKWCGCAGVEWQTSCMAPPYEKLHAWRESHELALAVYQATKTFPSDERYGLTSQLRRAAFSAAVNIVEGSSRTGRKEFRRFLDISLASLTEVGYALRFAKEAGLLQQAAWLDLSDRQNRARFLTWQLYRALGGGGSPPPTSTNPRPPCTNS